MPDSPLPDEAIRDRVIQQAVAGDYIGARQTVAEITARQCLREAWQAILYIQRDRGDVHGVKETIVSCSDRSLLYGHDYRELPIRFAKAGNMAGAIEIAKTMGSWGGLPLMLIPCALISKGDFVGAREAVTHIKDAAVRAMIMKLVDKEQGKSGVAGS
jgi:hypothetical protein